ncbi:reverse transcriptase domain-containing protein [Tanacetum coccineum]
MSTRFTSNELVSPLSNPENIIRYRQRNLDKPSLLVDFEEINMSNNQNNIQGPPPVGHIPQDHGPPGPNLRNSIPDLRSMEEFLHAPTDGVGDAIVVPLILTNQFELKIGLLNLVTSIAFHGFENDDHHSHIRRFTKITQTVKLNNVSHDVVKLLLFPFSLEGATRTWLKKEPPNSITTWNDLVSKFVNRFFPPSKTTNLRNEIMRFQQRFDETFSEAWDRFKDLFNKCPRHGFSPLHQIDTFYNSLNQFEQDSLNSAANGNFLTKNTQEALTIIKNKSKVQTSRNKTQVSSVSRSSAQDALVTALTKQVEALLSSMNRPVNSIENGCETCGGPHAYYEFQATGGYTQEDVYATMGTYNQGAPRSSKIPLFPTSSEIHPSLISSSSELPKQNPHQPPIPYPSRLNKDKLHDKSDIQIHKLLQMFKKLHFNINLAEALALIPNYAKILKDLLSDKEKLLGLANTSLTENCSAVLLKKLPKKLRDSRRFLILCDFQGIEACMALADLGASINLMPISGSKKLSLPDLTPTRMTLELAIRSIAYPAGIAEVRPFLRTARALVDVHGEELILRDDDEKLIFHADSTLKHPHKNGNESINMFNFIHITCEERFPEVLKIKKSNHPSSGNTIPLSDSFPSRTPFKTSDSLLEEFANELAFINPFPPGNDDNPFDAEVDLRELEYLLNRDPSLDSFRRIILKRLILISKSCLMNPL